MSLEDKVEDKESKGFIRKAGKLAWKLGMAAATTALSMAVLPTIGASVYLGVLVGSSFAAGGTIGALAKGEKLYDAISGGLTTYSAVNAVLSPMVWLQDVTVPLVAKYISDAWWVKGLYASTAYNAAFVGSYRGASHLVNNYLNPSGLGKAITQNFWPHWFWVGLTFSPFYTLAANGVTQLPVFNYKLPTFAVGALPVGIALSYLEKYWKKPKTSTSFMPSYEPATALAPAH
jgi:hypothetical protein